MNPISHATIFNALEKWAPKHLAYEWDNVGLQVGSYTEQTTKVLITLDVTESVVDEAIKNEANLIISHHPLLFQPLQQINIHSLKGKIIQKLLKNHISVYAAHTNLDLADGGVNDLIFDRLSLTSKEILKEVYIEKLIKLIVYIPNDYVSKVRKALGDVGVGHIGNYSHCAFQSKGQATFKPLAGANPFIGKRDIQEFVDETKLEMIMPDNLISSALAVLKSVHPYEEVAYDLYPLKNKGKVFGLGRIGDLDHKMSLISLSQKIKETFNISHVRITGDTDRLVQKVAVIGGSGEKYFRDAIAKKADVLITGDLTFHHALDAKEMGLAIIDPGHHIEEVMKQATKLYLEQIFTDIEMIDSKIDTNPFQFV